MQRLSGAWEALLKLILWRPVVGLFAVFAAGIVFWGGFNWSLELTKTQSFCVSCHEKKAYLYEEYRKSTHHDNRTGVRASCPDCHVPRAWAYKVARKVLATNELFHWLKGTIDTPEKFEIVSSFEITMGEKEHWAHPVICGGVLYMRHGDVLMAYNVKKKS